MYLAILKLIDFSSICILEKKRARAQCWGASRAWVDIAALAVSGKGGSGSERDGSGATNLRARLKMHAGCVGGSEFYLLIIKCGGSIVIRQQRACHYCQQIMSTLI